MVLCRVVYRVLDHVNGQIRLLDFIQPCSNVIFRNDIKDTKQLFLKSLRYFDKICDGRAPNDIDTGTKFVEALEEVILKK